MQHGAARVTKRSTRFGKRFVRRADHLIATSQQASHCGTITEVNSSRMQFKMSCDSRLCASIQQSLDHRASWLQDARAAPTQFPLGGCVIYTQTCVNNGIVYTSGFASLELLRLGPQNRKHPIGQSVRAFASSALCTRRRASTQLVCFTRRRASTQLVCFTRRRASTQLFTRRRASTQLVCFTRRRASTKIAGAGFEPTTSGL